MIVCWFVGFLQRSWHGNVPVHRLDFVKQNLGQVAFFFSKTTLGCTLSAIQSTCALDFGFHSMDFGLWIWIGNPGLDFARRATTDTVRIDFRLICSLKFCHRSERIQLISHAGITIKVICYDLSFFFFFFFCSHINRILKLHVR
jgi:hypothetical protein